MGDQSQFFVDVVGIFSVVSALGLKVLTLAPFNQRHIVALHEGKDGLFLLMFFHGGL
ncbi:hypothetical protein [Azospirillum aestuarii]|uniref:hypothetical protein n=1 Tax=Azospirillum aestuarii TaxID=2802052 RepID=UPI0040552B2A